MGHYISLMNGMTNAQADDLMAMLSALLDGSSAVVSTNDYKVTQSSPTGMSVLVGSGAGVSTPHRAALYISSANSYYLSLLDAQATLTIGSNASGSTRVDLICIKFDTGVSPDADASNIASLVVVAGTPGGGAPSTPANHYVLAQVSVASGASSISNANITDMRTFMTLNAAMNLPASVVTLTGTQTLTNKTLNADTFNNSVEPITTTTGTSTAYVLTPAVALTAYTGGARIPAIIHTDCGATPTVNISGLGAKSLKKSDGTAAAAGDIKAGLYELIYDGTDVRALGSSGGTTLTIASAQEVATGTDDTKYITALGASQYANTDIYRQAIINGSFEIAQRVTAPNLSTTYQYGAVDRIAAKGTGTAVSAGTIAQTTSPNVGSTGYALKLAGVTITGTGIVYMRYRMEAKDAVKFKNKTVSLGLKVRHDVGSSINYTIYLAKPTASDNYASTTAITNSGALAVANTTATQLKMEGVSIGDVTYGLEIEVQAACGAITTKNFEYAEMQLCVGSYLLPFSARSFDVELKACQRYYEKSYAYATAPTTAAQAAGIVMAKVASNTVAVGERCGPLRYTTVKRNNTSPTIYPYTTPTNTGRCSNASAGTDFAASSANVIFAGETGFSIRNDSGGTLATADLAVMFHYSVDCEL